MLDDRRARDRGALASRSRSLNGVDMSHSIEAFLEPNLCEDMISTVNGFIDVAYTRENAAARKAYIYEYAVAMQVFALYAAANLNA